MSDEEAEVMSDVQKAFSWVAVCLMICTAACCSGLNLGMLALDKMRLEAIMTCGTDEEKRMVRKLHPLLADRHLLIVILLLGNALAAEIMPLLLDDLVGTSITMIFGVSVLVIFCEILPQALCVKFGIKICSILSPFCWFLIFCSFLISWPLARLLDFIVGEEHTDYYSREELGELLTLHATSDFKPHTNEPLKVKSQPVRSMFRTGVVDVVTSQSKLKIEHLKQVIPERTAVGKEEPRLNYDQVSMTRGILEIHDKTVDQIMRSVNDCYMLELTTKLTRHEYQEIFDKSYSRIPIYFRERQNIVGIMLTKQLIKHDPDDCCNVNELDMKVKFPLIPHDSRLAEALTTFSSGSAHIGFVIGDNFQIIGFLTMEDILEQILQENIYDEADTRRQ